MKKYYEFTFENGDVYAGTVEDKNNFVKHLTKREKEEMGKIISKKQISEESYKIWMIKDLNYIW